MQWRPECLLVHVSPTCTHILLIPHWWLLHHYCCALGGSEDDRCVVWVCRCGDCLWGHIFCEWTQGLKRCCTQGHRGRVGSCRYSHLAFLYSPSRTTTRTYEGNFIGSATDTNVTGECALGSYMWTDERPDVRSPFAVYSVSRIWWGAWD